MLSLDPNTGSLVYQGNVTFEDAMKVNPKLIYARCQDASERPAGHKGDWPVQGNIYPIRMLTHPEELEQPRLAVLGFEGYWPYFNVFNAARFEPISVLFVN